MGQSMSLQSACDFKSKVRLGSSILKMGTKKNHCICCGSTAGKILLNVSYISTAKDHSINQKTTTNFEALLPMRHCRNSVMRPLNLKILAMYAQEDSRHYHMHTLQVNISLILPFTFWKNSVSYSLPTLLPTPSSGNMWLAKCDYIANLIDPANFSVAMDSVYPCHENLLHNKTILDKLEMRNGLHMSCYGLGRFAAEHWVHSHPRVRICDLYKNKSFVWGYEGLPDRPNRTRANDRRTQNSIHHTLVEDVTGYDFQVSPAPRFQDLRTYKLRPLQEVCPQTLEDRFREYQILYGESPDLSNLTDVSMTWWGWNVSNFRRILLDHDNLNTTISAHKPHGRGRIVARNGGKSFDRSHSEFAEAVLQRLAEMRERRSIIA